jgi:hypothetical protein
MAALTFGLALLGTLFGAIVLLEHSTNKCPRVFMLRSISGTFFEMRFLFGVRWQKTDDRSSSKSDWAMSHKLMKHFVVMRGRPSIVSKVDPQSWPSVLRKLSRLFATSFPLLSLQNPRHDPPGGYLSTQEHPLHVLNAFLCALEQFHDSEH